MSIPADLKYTKEHEWVKVEGNTVVVGITHYAQGELGDIVFVELPAVDDRVEQAETFGTIEAVKAVSDLFSPITGKVVAINERLQEEPELINSEPYGEGWMLKIEMSDPAEVEKLLSSGDYEKIITEGTSPG
jgi:glycine cleavage system H protein